MSIKTQRQDQIEKDNRRAIVDKLYNDFLLFSGEYYGEKRETLKKQIKYYNKKVIVNFDHHSTIYKLSRLCHWLNIPEDNK